MSLSICNTAVGGDLPQLDVRAVLHAGEHVGQRGGVAAVLGLRQRDHHRRRGQEVSRSCVETHVQDCLLTVELYPYCVQCSAVVLTC